MTLYKGDNTEAFGGNLLKINLINDDGVEITKAEIRIGIVLKTIESPQFPLYVNFNEEESDMLNYINDVYVALYDSQGRKKTVEGTLRFKAQKRRV